MRLVDRFRRALSTFLEEDSEPEETAERPKPGRWISGIRSDYDIDLEARRATPEKLGTLLRAADAGDIQAQCEIFEEIERDAYVNRLYNKRRQVVVGSKLLLSAPNETPEAQRALELCNEQIFGPDAQGGVENLDEGLNDLSDAIGKAFAVAQNVWSVEGGIYRLRRIERWPQKEFMLGKVGAIYEQDEDELWVRTIDQMATGVSLDDFPAGTWVVHRQKSASAPLARAALFRSVAWPWLFKHFGWRDWSIFLERYGIPPRVGKHPAGADDKERAALLTALRDFGKDRACVVPEGSSIEIFAQTMSAGSTAPHPALIDAANKEISVAISGSTMAVDQGNRGARSAKEAYQTEEWDQAVSDAQKLANTIRYQILKPIVRLNLGDKAPIPACAFQLSEDEDLKVRAETDDLLVNKIGLPLSKSYFYEKYDRPIPTDEDELVEGAGGVSSPIATGPFSADQIESLLGLAALGAQKKSSQDWVASTLWRNKGKSVP